MNLRLGRFWSVVKLHENYNMTFSSSPPKNMIFQIQETQAPNGNPNDWVIIRIYFPIPNSIEVKAKINGTESIKKPFPIQQGVPEDLNDHTSTCGANNYHYENGTIEFVVSGGDNCQVRVRLTNHIKLTARLDIPISDFYSNDGATSFLTNICAFLGIDTSRMRIVGIREGSTVVLAEIITDGQNTTEEDDAELSDMSGQL